MCRENNDIGVKASKLDDFEPGYKPGSYLHNLLAFKNDKCLAAL